VPEVQTLDAERAQESDDQKLRPFPWIKADHQRILRRIVFQIGILN